ncbi:MAG: hypothetical protein U1F68_11285 [Gammaproteobacteria bacterium]
MIGNPQNILIAQLGNLQFWPFTLACAVPALFGLFSVYLVVWLTWRRHLHIAQIARPAPPLPALDRWQLGKAVVATGALLVLFTLPLPHATGVLIVTGAMLVSRKLASRIMLGMVDWHLLVLFASLFIVTAALSHTGLTARAIAQLVAAGWLPDRLAVLAPLALAGSNTIGNVPAVMLLLAVWPDPSAAALYGLAVFSTLAGNFLLVGSIANLIVVERAKDVGVSLGFIDHTRCGVVMTLLAMGFAWCWFWLTGMMPM